MTVEEEGNVQQQIAQDAREEPTVERERRAPHKLLEADDDVDPRGQLRLEFIIGDLEREEWRRCEVEAVATVAVVLLVAVVVAVVE